MHRNLRRWGQNAAALGFLSVSLTGEVSSAWVALSWAAWFLAFGMDRMPDFQARLRRLETGAVAGMLGLLICDFLVYRSTIFIAVTHFLLLFQMVKLVGEKTRKDCFQIFLFSFLQVLAACTLSVDVWQAGILLLMIPTAAATLFWNQMEKDHQDAHLPDQAALHRRYGRMAAFISVTALPLNLFLTVAVFVIFPRLTLNVSLPGFGNPQAGFTDQVNLAQKGSLRQNKAVVLWLSFPNAEERRQWDGYLRGEVLSEFDGRRWSTAKGTSARFILPDSNGIFVIRPQGSLPVLHETFTLADTSAGALFAAGTPLRVVAPLPSLQETEGGALRWAAPWRRPLRYDVTAESLSDVTVLPAHLALPAMALERIRKLAQVESGKGSPMSQARRLEQFLQKNYRYSTDFGERIAEDPIAYFLFDRRMGNCGHFASAMAVMLRLQKIPSRLVAGYFKGEWNEPAESIVIREQDAHAWVEAFIPGKGWVSFDPTPPAPPEAAAQKNLWRALRQYWDYGSLQWNRLVIQYDLHTQVRAYESLKGTSGRFGQVLYSWWLRIQRQMTHRRPIQAGRADDQARDVASFPYKRTGTFSVLALAGAWLFLRKRHVSLHQPVRFYRRFLDRMARAGHPKALHETGWEFAERLSRLDPALSELAHRTTVKYYQVRFRKGHV